MSFDDGREVIVRLGFRGMSVESERDKVNVIKWMFEMSEIWRRVRKLEKDPKIGFWFMRKKIIFFTTSRSIFESPPRKLNPTPKNKQTRSSTRSSPLNNGKPTAVSGCNEFLPSQPPVPMSFKQQLNSISDSVNDKPEKLEFARFVENSTNKDSTNWSARSR